MKQDRCWTASNSVEGAGDGPDVHSDSWDQDARTAAVVGPFHARELRSRQCPGYGHRHRGVGRYAFGPRHRGRGGTAEIRPGAEPDGTVSAPAGALAVGRFHSGMDPAV